MITQCKRCSTQFDAVNAKTKLCDACKAVNLGKNQVSAAMYNKLLDIVVAWDVMSPAYKQILVKHQIGRKVKKAYDYLKECGRI